jgi:hypothetical protein
MPEDKSPQVSLTPQTEEPGPQTEEPVTVPPNAQAVRQNSRAPGYAPDRRLIRNQASVGSPPSSARAGEGSDSKAPTPDGR